MANDYNSKRFYWIKLRENFMTSDAVDFLMGQKDGSNYVVLYQMLCLKTANTGGELSRTIGEMIIPYDVDKITRDVKWFSKDTVIVALELYKKLGLIFKNENGNLVISNYDKMVGSETQSAIYKQGKKELEIFQLDSNRYKDIKTLDNKILNIREIENKITYFENEDLNCLFIEFLSLRKKLKAQNTDSAIKVLITKLNKYNDDTKKQMIENSIENSWKGLFEIKGTKNIETKPKWFDNKIETKSASKEELEEIQQILNNY